jgi:hypothetical protein
MGSLVSTSAHPPHPAYSYKLRLAIRVVVHMMNGFEQDLRLLAGTAIQSLASGVEYIQGRQDLSDLTEHSASPVAPPLP